MLENQILTFTAGYKQVTKFLHKAVARFLGWPECPHDWTPFKMADDIQLKQHMLMLSQMNKIGDSTLLSHFGKNPVDEKADIEASMKQANRIAKDQLLVQAEAQVEAMEMQQQAQMEMQQQQSTGLPAEMSQTAAQPVQEEESQEEFAYRMAEQLSAQPDDVVQQVLQQVAQQSPELAQYIYQLIQQLRAESQQQYGQQYGQQTQQYGQQQAQPAEQQPAVGGYNQAQVVSEPAAQLQQQYTASTRQMMQPQPQMRPPRRGPASAAI
jgi:hypothetical protein